MLVDITDFFVLLMSFFWSTLCWHGTMKPSVYRVPSYWLIRACAVVDTLSTVIERVCSFLFIPAAA